MLFRIITGLSVLFLALSANAQVSTDKYLLGVNLIDNDAFTHELFLDSSKVLFDTYRVGLGIGDKKYESFASDKRSIEATEFQIRWSMDSCIGQSTASNMKIDFLVNTSLGFGKTYLDFSDKQGNGSFLVTTLKNDISMVLNSRSSFGFGLEWRYQAADSSTKNKFESFNLSFKEEMISPYIRLALSF